MKRVMLCVWWNMRRIWEFIPHSRYVPNLVPTDFHISRSLQNSLDGKKFE
ncbi:hypothetical protein WH47_01628 [Habropoda laboriosa]|uniref:Histone-lysine N-methyltransferase SETMAR n=1 Tax=Habropoda laboriosa TaxID=597456 RepID=A0A0L7R5Q8_9HYME|nr:hypothetical protein WH47_01628 [Habropoda laboriosa]